MSQGRISWAIYGLKVTRFSHRGHNAVEQPSKESQNWGKKWGPNSKHPKFSVSKKLQPNFPRTRVRGQRTQEEELGMAENTWFIWKSVPENVSNGSRRVIAHVCRWCTWTFCTALNCSRALLHRLGRGEGWAKATSPEAGHLENFYSPGRWHPKLQKDRNRPNPKVPGSHPT